MKMFRLALLLGLLALCGCAHRQYVMKLSNGRQMTVVGKPKLKGSTYYYKDATGEQNGIPQGRVREIQPASMAEKENKFKPAKPKRKHWYWPFWAY